jgi:hypothetical protein
MASQINADYPAATSAYTANVRQNFAYAKSEIEALQGAVDATTGTVTTGSIELGHASDTTLARSGAGVVTIEGSAIITAADVDDTPVDAATGVPVSSNWAYDHAALATAHGITTAAATVLDDTTVAAMVNTLGGATSTGTGGLVRATGPTLTGATLAGTLDGDGQEIARNLTRVVAVDNSSTGQTLTAGDHSGCVITTNGTNTITIPTTAGFNCVIIAGGAHTVTFNATASAAMASGDLMTLVVQSSSVIHAVLTASANKVTFSA